MFRFTRYLRRRRVCRHQEEIRLAVASRSPVDEGGAARGILGALGLIDKFCCLEIHRGSKAVHFQVGAAVVVSTVTVYVRRMCSLSFDGALPALAVSLDRVVVGRPVLAGIIDFSKPQLRYTAPPLHPK